MYSLTLLFTSLVVGFAAAQNSTNAPLTGVDPTTLNQWCNAQRNNCPLLCGGPANIKSNICLGNDIQNYNCTCSNNTAPAMIANYTDTVPYFICKNQFQQCRKNEPGSTACADCGTWAPSSAPKFDAAAVSSSSAAASSSATGTGSSSSAPASTSAKAAAPTLGPEHAVGGAAMGVLAAIGMLL